MGPTLSWIPIVEVQLTSYTAITVPAIMPSGLLNSFGVMITKERIIGILFNIAPTAEVAWLIEI